MFKKNIFDNNNKNDLIFDEISNNSSTGDNIHVSVSSDFMACEINVYYIAADS